MAKISDRDPGRQDGGYTRIFDNAQLGALLSQVHATSISAGSELEKMVFINTVTDFDHFIDNIPEVNGVYIASKSIIKKSKKYKAPKTEPDAIIFILEETKKVCNIIELKDGDTFDTKKVEGELEALKKFRANISPKIQFIVDYFICGFNSSSKQTLHVGLKQKVAMNHLMTGTELCAMIGVDYNAIIQSRKADAVENVDYFIDGLLSIDSIKTMILDKIAKDKPQE